MANAKELHAFAQEFVLNFNGLETKWTFLTGDLGQFTQTLDNFGRGAGLIAKAHFERRQEGDENITKRKPQNGRGDGTADDHHHGADVNEGHEVPADKNRSANNANSGYQANDCCEIHFSHPALPCL